MIRWLTQTLSDLPEAFSGDPPPGLLSPAETARFLGLQVPKRRQDWLLGRWTSKRLLQAIVRQDMGEFVPLEDLTVLPGPDGAPYATWENRLGELPISLSISHSGDRAFCAAFGLVSGGQMTCGLLGADIEKVEPRSDLFIQDFFTETENALFASRPARDILVTATWSAKEASLKALHLGLVVDTRSVTCLIEPVLDPPDAWTPFSIEWDVRRLYRRPTVGPPPLGGWWRIQDDYVLTLAGPPHRGPDETPARMA